MQRRTKNFQELTLKIRQKLSAFKMSLQSSSSHTMSLSHDKSASNALRLSSFLIIHELNRYCCNISSAKFRDDTGMANGIEKVSALHSLARTRSVANLLLDKCSAINHLDHEEAQNVARLPFLLFILLLSLSFETNKYFLCDANIILCTCSQEKLFKVSERKFDFHRLPSSQLT
jgi:hypothetical protein